MNPILRNFLSLALGRYVSIGIGAVVVVFLGRSLGVLDSGRFMALLAAAELLAAALDLGLNRILLREGSAHPERTGAHLFNILIIKSILTAALLVGAHFYALHQGPLYQLMVLLVLTKVADNVAVTFDAVFQIHQRMEYSAIILVLARLGLLLAVVSGWRNEAGLLYFGWTYFGVSLGSALLTTLFSGRFTRPRRGDIAWRETVGREGLFFALSSLLYMAATRMDMVYLKESVDALSLGLYTFPARIMVVFQILPLVLQTAVLPELFRLGRHDRAALGPFYGTYFRRSLLLAAFPVVWTLIFAEVILGRLWGADFLPGAPWLRMLIWLLPLRFISFAAGNVLTALERQGERTLWSACGVGTSLLLLFLLVPRVGVEGAIRALLIGEGLMALLNLIAAGRRGYLPVPGTLARVVMGAALGAALLLVLRAQVSLGFIGGLAATALCVALGLLLTRAATLGELRGILAKRH